MILICLFDMIDPACCNDCSRIFRLDDEGPGKLLVQPAKGQWIARSRGAGVCFGFSKREYRPIAVDH